MRKVGKAGGGACIMGAVLAAFVAIHPESTIETKHLSARGAGVVLNVEGCEKSPYYCSADRLTVGVGHTGKDVKPTDSPRSEEEIAALLHKDITYFERCVEKRVGKQNVKDMSQGVFDSHVIFTMNVGCGNYNKSSQARDASQGNYAASCQHFPKWANIRKNGKLVSCFENRKLCGGVADRRLQEQNICESKLWPLWL